MLLLLLTTLFGLYLYGPDLVARRALSFFMHTKSRQPLPKPEEIFEIVWSSFPLISLALLWTMLSGDLSNHQSTLDIKIVFSSLYSEKYFLEHTGFANALSRFLFLNLRVLLRLYTVAALYGLAAGLLAPSVFSPLFRGPRLLRRILYMALPSIPEWYAVLGGWGKRGSVSVEVDILTKSGGLIRGAVVSFTLDKSDELATVSLSKTLEIKRASDRSVDTMIIGDRVTMMASDISRINVRYVPIQKSVVLDELLDNQLNNKDRPPPHSGE